MLRLVSGVATLFWISVIPSSVSSFEACRHDLVYQLVGELGAALGGRFGDSSVFVPFETAPASSALRSPTDDLQGIWLAAVANAGYGLNSKGRLVDDMRLSLADDISVGIDEIDILGLSAEKSAELDALRARLYIEDGLPTPRYKRYLDLSARFSDLEAELILDPSNADLAVELKALQNALAQLRTVEDFQSILLEVRRLEAQDSESWKRSAQTSAEHQLMPLRVRRPVSGSTPASRVDVKILPLLPLNLGLLDTSGFEVRREISLGHCFAGGLPAEVDGDDVFFVSFSVIALPLPHESALEAIIAGLETRAKKGNPFECEAGEPPLGCFRALDGSAISAGITIPVGALLLKNFRIDFQKEIHARNLRDTLLQEDINRVGSISLLGTATSPVRATSSSEMELRPTPLITVATGLRSFETPGIFAAGLYYKAFY